MNTLLLNPTDILFFRDGRPMSGSLAGHGAAWPLPSVINAALHAALHRATFKEKVHEHRRGRSSKRPEDAHRDRKFGSLTTVGPFPVSPDLQWLFPRPLDAGMPDSTKVTYLPAKDFNKSLSSLSDPLKYSAANTGDPSKDPLAPWWSTTAWVAYLDGREMIRSTAKNETDPDFNSDSDFSDAESTFGIGTSADTDTQDGERFYSAQYLRLRQGWNLGVIAEANDKVTGDEAQSRDLIPLLFSTDKHILVGGQQRVCSATLHSNGSTLSLPRGMSSGFVELKGKILVKWVLLSPAIFPQINGHHGGWLPSWIDMLGKVQLLDGPGSNFAKRHKVAAGKPISATLVAAITGKPVPVTGYALDNGMDDRAPGPKSTHLAVPAGSVYYFECDTVDSASALANALNWDGLSKGVRIENRRSTLMGEKGFGLGVCGTWNFHKE